MMRATLPLLAVALALTIHRTPLAGQGGGDPMDFSRPAQTSAQTRGIPPDILARAVEAYNSAKPRINGDAQSLGDIAGTLGIYKGDGSLTGQVGGEVVVINGNLRIEASARIRGRITVLGGRLFVDRGALVGDTVVYADPAGVELQGDMTLRVRNNATSLTRYSSTSFSSGNVRGEVRLTPGTYNRVEGFSFNLSPTLTWQIDSTRSLLFSARGIARTGTAPGEHRAAFGGEIGVIGYTLDPWPISLGVQLGSVIAPTADRPFTPLESGLSALLLRRDYRDWYKRRYWEVLGDWRMRPELTVGAKLTFSKEEGIRAVDAFSLIRSSEPWRPNPLIDDGKFSTLSLGARYDTRDNRDRPLDGTDARVQLSSVMSHSLTPVALPTSIRDEMPSTGYSSLEFSFDVRQYTRLSPSRSVHLRLSGTGWLGGDPMTLQRRNALGGGDLSGYGFRAINCDPRKAPDLSLPALCDRQMIVQGEYRQGLVLDLSTKVGSYTVGFQQPDLVFFGDAGSAWRAGDGVGEVPSGRLQSVREWRYDVGVGLEGSLFGLYLAKSLRNDEPIRLMFRFGPRF